MRHPRILNGTTQTKEPQGFEEGATPGRGWPRTATRADPLLQEAASGGDGTARSPFSDLSDALAEANTSAAAVVVKVAPGDYPVADSLVIDRPIELRGSTILIEDADGWPTGAVVPGTATRIFTTNPLGTRPLIAVGRADAIVISDVGIRGFVFESRVNGPEVAAPEGAAERHV